MLFFSLIQAKIKYKQFYRNAGYGNQYFYSSRFKACPVIRRITRVQGFRVSEFQSFRVSEVQRFRVSEFSISM